MNWDIALIIVCYLGVNAIVFEIASRKKERKTHRENDIRRKAMEEGFRRGWCSKF